MALIWQTLRRHVAEGTWGWNLLLGQLSSGTTISLMVEVRTESFSCILASRKLLQYIDFGLLCVCVLEKKCIQDTMSLDFMSRETQAHKWTFVIPTLLWDLTVQRWKHITFNFHSPFWSQNVLCCAKTIFQSQLTGMRETESLWKNKIYQCLFFYFST